MLCRILPCPIINKDHIELPYCVSIYVVSIRLQKHTYIFIMRRMQEKHRQKQRSLYYAFVDLERTPDWGIEEDSIEWAF